MQRARERQLTLKSLLDKLLHEILITQYSLGEHMANHPSAEKRARVAKRRAARNSAAISRMKTALKKVRSATDKAKAASDLNRTMKLLDQLAAKGVIHKNKAANQKSKLTRFVNAMK